VAKYAHPEYFEDKMEGRKERSRGDLETAIMFKG
jgi:hypothetical protein